MSERSLKDKTVVALSWSLIDKLGQLLFSFGSLAILARTLSKAEFGMVASLSIFTALSTLLFDSGFSASLIKKKEATEQDFSTIFFFNIGISITLYIILYFCSPLIALYFETPDLTLIARVLFLSIPLNGLWMIQNIYYLKRIQLNFLTKVNLFATAISVTLSIIAALYGLGVWALVIQVVSLALFKAILFWSLSQWKPKGTFSYHVFKQHFSFSRNMLITGIINTIYQRIYILIGRIYSMSDLGIYDNANKYQEVSSNLIANTFRNVALPVLAHVNNEPVRLKNAFRKVICTMAYVTFPLMFLLGLAAKPLITILMTEAWISIASILTILCIGGAFNPFCIVISDTLLAKGKSDLYLRLEIIKKAFFTIGIAFFITKGASALAWVWSAYMVIGCLLSLLFIHKQINYKFREMTKDILPYLIGSLAIATLIWLSPLKIDSPFLHLLVIGVGYLTIYILGCSLLKSNIQQEVLRTIKEKISKTINSLIP